MQKLYFYSSNNMSGCDNQIIHFFFSEYCIGVPSVTLLSIVQGVNYSSRFLMRSYSYLWSEWQMYDVNDMTRIWLHFRSVRYVRFWKSSSPKKIMSFQLTINQRVMWKIAGFLYHTSSSCSFRGWEFSCGGLVKWGVILTHPVLMFYLYIWDFPSVTMIC